MAARTDVHRPSAPDFDPEAYELLDVFDLHPDGGDRRARTQLISRMRDQGHRFASHAVSGACGHCGAHIRYAALLLHEPTGEMIDVGQQCLVGRFDALTAQKFHELRETARLNRERRTAMERVEAFIADSHPHLVELTYAQNMPWLGDFVMDVGARFVRSGSLSDRQVEAVMRALDRDHGRETTRIEREAAEALEIKVEVPEGRREVTGEIVHLRVDDTAYGTVLKMLLKADGYKLWGTVPRAIADDAKRGQHVVFTATVERSPDDPYFGFIKRPSGARLVDATV